MFFYKIPIYRTPRRYATYGPVKLWYIFIPQPGLPEGVLAFCIRYAFRYPGGAVPPHPAERFPRHALTGSPQASHLCDHDRMFLYHIYIYILYIYVSYPFLLKPFVSSSGLLVWLCWWCQQSINQWVPSMHVLHTQHRLMTCK